jgi:hypothetical protein
VYQNLHDLLSGRAMEAVTKRLLALLCILFVTEAAGAILAARWVLLQT